MRSAFSILATSLHIALCISSLGRALPVIADLHFGVVPEPRLTKRSDISINGNEECMLATTEQVQALSGYQPALEKVALDYGGARPLYGQVNLERWPTFQAQWCRSRTPVLCAAVPNSGNCFANSARATSAFVNTNGSISQTLQSTVSRTTVTTISKSSQKTWEWSIEPSLKIKEAVEIGGSYSWGGSEMNTTSQTFSTTSLSTSSETTSVQVKAGQSCSIVTQTTSCSEQYQANTQSYLKGYVIYQWDRAVTYTGQPKSNKHMTWMRWMTLDWTNSGLISNDGLSIVYNYYNDSVGKAVCVDA